MSEVSEDIIITKHSDLYTGAEFLCNALAQSGVTHVYGGHGGAVVPIIDAIVAHPSLTWVRIWCHGSFCQAKYVGINIVLMTNICRLSSFHCARLLCAGLLSV